MASMRAKRARRIRRLAPTAPGALMRNQQWAPGGTVPHGVRLVGEQPGHLHPPVPAAVNVVRRPWVQRFLRSFLGYRRHLGTIMSLRAAWIVANA